MMPSKYRVFLLPFSFSGAVNVFRYHTGPHHWLNHTTHSLKRGFLAPAIRYPTVPRGTARLRVTVTAAHRTVQIGRLGKALEELLHG